MGNNGRIVIPAEVRQRLAVGPDEDLVIAGDENGVYITTVTAEIREFQEYCKSLAPPDVIMSEELIAERRAEAAKEDSDDCGS